MKHRFALTLTLLLAIAALAGCGKKSSSVTSPGGSSGTSSGTAMERAEAAAVVAQVPEIVEDGVFETDTQMNLSANEYAGALSAIRPLLWWRKIRHVERSFEFAFSDTDSTGRPTLAIVTVHKHLTGTFNILTATPHTDSTTSDSTRDSLRVVKKTLDDEWVRKLMLKRIPPRFHDEDGDGDDDDQGEDDATLTASHHGDRGDSLRWKLVATTGVEVTSKDATTEIQSVRIETGTKDTTVTDPLVLWHLRRFVALSSMDTVKITVTTGRNDDVVVLFSRWGRTKFHNNGDNTYTRTWRAPFFAGVGHLGVNAFSHGTLYDDESPYDSNAWILPYVIRGFQCGDYLPKD